MKARLKSGQIYPLGATLMSDQGVNFSVYSKFASKMSLLLFDHADAPGPSQELVLDPELNRTGQYWHILVPKLENGQLYAWRADGPTLPEEGIRFEPQKVLLDPYGKLVDSGNNYDRKAAIVDGDNSACCMKSVVAESRGFDWEDDRPLCRPSRETVIYEMHVGGFTRNPNSGVPAAKRGTFAGVIEKIPYLQELGITAVELMPVFQYDRQDCAPGLSNYWGYSPVSLFAPHREYSSDKSPLGPMNEFRAMVKALHKADIEVILDVVYNHTAEGGEDGPTFCFKGLANEVYYTLSKQGHYQNFSGCGNTLNAYNSVTRRLILDSLRYWVQHMHVDGFRFDLAAILSRDEDGTPLANPPLLWSIDTDPILGGTKIIAEAWDAGGLYQVGSFSGDRWKQWNGQFRDDVRRFVRGDPGMVGKIVQRMFASPDLFAHRKREPEQSINFVTCHDGFTLNDLVSYNEKHNEANREQNRDGSNHNYSWNCGAEGPTDDPQIERLRLRQIKNCLTLTLMAFGTPMLSMGDEVRRTQQGNNNAYCQDNALSWFDWSGLSRHREMLRFTRQLIRLRHQLDFVHEQARLNLVEFLQFFQVQWHGIHLDQPDWSESSRSLAAQIVGAWRETAFYVIFNAYWEPLEFEIPDASSTDNPWHRIIDTAIPSPEDIQDVGQSAPITQTTYTAAARSIVVLQRTLSEQ